MTKTTIKVEVATRKRIRILAARLDVDMDEAINRAAECLESSLPGEGVNYQLLKHVGLHLGD